MFAAGTATHCLITYGRWGLHTSAYWITASPQSSPTAHAPYLLLPRHWETRQVNCSNPTTAYRCSHAGSPCSQRCTTLVQLLLQTSWIPPLALQETAGALCYAMWCWYMGQSNKWLCVSGQVLIYFCCRCGVIVIVIREAFLLDSDREQ